MKSKLINIDLLFDLMFIDADHSYQGVKNDLELYKDLCKSGGYLFLHDTLVCPSVKKLHEDIVSGKYGDIEFVYEFIDKNWRNPCGIGLYKKK